MGVVCPPNRVSRRRGGRLVCFLALARRGCALRWLLDLMADDEQKRTCPDCGSALLPIKLLDKWGAVGERKVFEELTFV